ncbi:MAG: ATP-binding protein [Ruminococcus sp.]|nr:ATP-binding protein [Ruminococcus sp.]
MDNLSELLLQAKTLVIFKSLHEQPVFKKFLTAAQACLGDDKDDAISKYCDFVSELYAYSDDLTEYILKLVLENENLFMLRKGEGKPTGVLLEECLASELETIQELSEVPSAELTGRLGYDGFLPKYKTQALDFSQIYADRIHAIGSYGYGIYSQYHVFVIENSKIVPVEFPDPIKLSQLSNYKLEREQVIRNTLALLSGKPANNVLLYGDCGTGKSSTVKAIANEYYTQGLRLIELKKKQLHELPKIVETVSKNPLKFIIFIDDLSFTEDDDDFAALKAILEGSVSSNAANLAIYATSNRRHLVRETFSARQGDEIHFKDTMQELLSLSDRFGLTVTFQKPDKKIFLEVVSSIAEQYQLDMPQDELYMKAEAYALARGGRSPRVAKQFIEYLKGCGDNA